MKNLQNFKKKLLKKAKGTAAIEYVIVTPFSLAICVFSIMILVFILDFHAISSNLSQICHELNMGDTGYKEVYNLEGGNTNYQIHNNTTYRYKEFMDSSNNYHMDIVSWEKTGSNVPVKIGGNRDKKYFDAAVCYNVRLADEKGLFAMPFMEMNDLQCNITTTNGMPFNVKKGITESGSIIKVTGQFRFCGFADVSITSAGFID